MKKVKKIKLRELLKKLSAKELIIRGLIKSTIAKNVLLKY
jgi:hypothetical protein